MSRHRIVAVILALVPIFACAQSRFLQSTDEGRTVTEGIIASVAAGNMAGGDAGTAAVEARHVRR